MAAEKVSKGAGNPAKKAGNGKWIALGLVGLVVFIAAQAGFLGFGWAHVRAAVFPRDESLLEYVPADAGGALILDPHQLDPKALGGEESAARQWLARTRTELKKATDIDVLFDVDKLVLSPTLAVARGRFDGKKLAQKLGEARYKAAEHQGQSYLVSKDDAVAVIDDTILLYGDEAGIRAGLDARQAKTSLGHSDAVTARLKSVGWDHPILFTVQVTDERPSIRAILAGSTGPRAVTVGVTTRAGMDIDATVELASAAAADELKKLLEEKRKDAEALKPVVGSEAANVLLGVIKRGTLGTEEGFLKIHLHVEPAELDALIKAADKASPPLGEMYKNLRLIQLLVPGL
ncbi:MAG: hypothetical protein U0359_14740 [Byssovorax sp.]